MAGPCSARHSRTRRTLKEDILETLPLLAPHAEALGSTAALQAIRRSVDDAGNGASWLRAEYKSAGTLNDVVRRQSHLWTAGAQALERTTGQ